jgi:hypothetical protein
METYTLAAYGIDGLLYAHKEKPDGSGTFGPIPEDHPDFALVAALAKEQAAANTTPAVSH